MRKDGILGSIGLGARSLFLGLGLFLIMNADSWCQEQREKIVVGGGTHFLPMIFLDREGQAMGMHIDLWRLWSEKTGIPVEFRLMDWSETLPALLRGDVDVVNGMSFTEERAQVLDFTDPFDHLAVYIYFHEDMGFITGLEDLIASPVGVLQGSDSEALIEQTAPKVKCVPYINHEEMIRAAVSGKLRFFVGEEPLVPYCFVQHYRGRPIPFKRAKEPLFSSDLRMAVKKGNVELLDMITQGFGLISEKESHEIRDRWIGVALESHFPWKNLGTILLVLIAVLLTLFSWNALLQARVRRMTRDLLQSQSMYKTLMDSSPMGIWHSDAKGKTLYINAAMCRTLEVKDVAELDIKGFASFFPSQSLETLNRENAKRAGGISSVYEIEVLGAKGSKRTCVVHGSPLMDRKEILEGTIGIFLDITEQKRLQEELLQAQKMEAMGRLAGGMAHDFNNHLTAIMALTSILIESFDSEDERVKDVALILEAAERSSSLTKKLLAFSRKHIIMPHPMALGRSIEGLQEMLRRLLGEDIDLEMIRVGPDPWILADKGQIEQVILNLAVNARDAMPRGGPLKILVSEVYLNEDFCKKHLSLVPGRYAHIVVEDNGIGMDPEVQQHIFEPFFTTKEMGKGTGLGLSTVYGIVQQCGGEIFVKSQPGQGTRFLMYFPAIEKLEDQKISTDSRVESLEEVSRTVLVTEDDPLTRASIRRILEEAGYQVFEAASGEEALTQRIHVGGSLDLLLTDVVMPGINGKELAQELGQRWPDMAVLYMSGYTSSILGEEQESMESSWFLQKPFGKEQLLRAVEEALQKRQDPTV